MEPAGPSLNGYPEVCAAYKDAGESRGSTAGWHINGSPEHQPPGLTFLYVLECQESVNELVFSNLVEVYNKLSSGFKENLHGLTAEYSDVKLFEFSKKVGGVVRRNGITGVHPIIRTHPATGKNSLFVAPGCTFTTPTKESELTPL